MPSINRTDWSGPRSGPTYHPHAGLYVCWMSRRAAEEHTRRVHNVPAGVRLGWAPYTILITTAGGVSHTAFHSARALRHWLRGAFRVVMSRSSGGARFGTLCAR